MMMAIAGFFILLIYWDSTVIIMKSLLMFYCGNGVIVH